MHKRTNNNTKSIIQNNQNNIDLYENKYLRFWLVTITVYVILQGKEMFLLWHTIYLLQHKNHYRNIQAPLREI